MWFRAVECFGLCYERGGFLFCGFEHKCRNSSTFSWTSEAAGSLCCCCCCTLVCSDPPVVSGYRTNTTLIEALGGNGVHFSPWWWSTADLMMLASTQGTPARFIVKNTLLRLLLWGELKLRQFSSAVCTILWWIGGCRERSGVLGVNMQSAQFSEHPWCSNMHYWSDCEYITDEVNPLILCLNHRFIDFLQECFCVYIILSGAIFGAHRNIYVV